MTTPQKKDRTREGAVLNSMRRGDWWAIGTPCIGSGSIEPTADKGQINRSNYPPARRYVLGRLCRLAGRRSFNAANEVEQQRRSGGNISAIVFRSGL